MKKFLLASTIVFALFTNPVKQLSACTSPTLTTKRANLTVDASCHYDQQRPTWTCTATTGTYKILVGVTAAGSGGTYSVTVNENGNQVLQRSFTGSGGNCAAGDFTVTLTNGNTYELVVDGASNIPCDGGELAWAKMCYTCGAQ